MLRRLLAFVPLLVSLAATAAEVYVPPTLEPWKAWVLHGEEQRLCPSLPSAQTPEGRVCAWPGMLALSLDAQGGRFEQTWQVQAESWLPLPGGEHWPQEVRVNDKPVAVIEHEGHPALRLPAGDYRIGGRFVWSARPERLEIPEQSALLSLELDGKPVAWPERESDALWLGRRQEVKKEAESLQVEVFRHLADGHPAYLETRLNLQVSGPGREILIDRVLLAGFQPTELSGELPARLEADGRLRVQVRPGSWDLGISTRAEAPLKALSLPEGPGAAEEVWSFSHDERARISSLEGAPSVDPGEAGVPGEWQKLPAYRVLPGQTLSVVERSRGLASQDANQLSLSRRIWLSFAGDEYVFQDRLSGQMHQGWRLDMRAPFVLRQAQANGDELLITGGGEGLTGVELREPQVNLETLGTLPRGEALRATGWEQLINGVETTLNLPPGYRLIAASGADAAPDAWLSRWTLLDFFLLLVLAVAIGKLLGWPWGALSLVLIGLTLHEARAPLWSWLNLAAAVALVRYLPDNRFRRYLAVFRNASLALVAVLAVPFLAMQLRLALYPQLEAEFGGVPSRGAAQYAQPAGAPAPMAEMAADQAVMSGAVSEQKRRQAQQKAEVDRREVAGSRMKSADMLSRYAADAKIQTGPGLPSWSWSQARLSWSGPVAADQALDLVILPPAGLAFCRVLVVALIALLLAVFARQCFPGPRWPRWMPGAAALPALCVLALLPWGQSFAASVPPRPEPPSASILAELKRRLLAPEPCAPRCAELPAARVIASGDYLSVELDVQALTKTPVAVPGRLDGWYPRKLLLSGVEVPVLRAQDAYWVLVPAGLSRISLEGAMPPADSVQLRFPERPRLVSARAEGWELGGAVDGLLQGEHLEFTRIKASEDDAQGWEEMTRIPAFVEVRRRLTFDRDFWVHTQVLRRAPATAPISVAIPLLEGEAVQTAEAKLSAGKVLVSLPAGADSYEWDSTLPRLTELKLTATPSADFIEKWSYAASPSLHVEHGGVPVLAQEPGISEYQPEFYPLPGESLNLTFSRPAAAEGDTLAIDGVQLASTVGQRATDVQLTIHYRSSRGGQHEIRLPVDAEVSHVSAGGKRLGLRPEQGKLLLPIQPGSHQFNLSWRQSGEIGLRQAPPAVDLRHAVSNIDLSLNLGADRWVLLTGGPRLGPAVLYWGELAAFALLAWGLGRIGLTPLKTRHWLLLGLGLSTLAWPTLFLVTAWLFVLAWRGRAGEKLSPAYFNLAQLGLGFLTLFALAALVAAIPQALLSTPDMHILGNDSSGGSLRWFADETAGAMPEAFALSLPIWVYRLAMLAWSLWLSLALIGWLRWGWGAFAAGGVWKNEPAKTTAAETKPASDTQTPE
ncbi:MAG: hypothetical protein HYV16_10380 [Gammaproteobacteria bacterium]|nr:hypothetical protein [Gammaproteobacteria bacterium]